jgi:predicted TIM-barrel fold metal-dependent hydrolase
MEPVEETKRVHEMTVQSTGKRYGKTRVAAGIVGFADLTLGAAVVPVLEAHIAASDRFRGIRQLSNWDENQDVIMSSGKPGLLLNDKFREGFAYLGNYDISFETFLFHPQLMDLVDLAKAFPDIPVILEHAGGLLRIGPYAKKHEEVIQTWKDGMAALADCPNVSVKLGGFGMPIFGFGWHEQPAPPDSTEFAEKMAPFVFWCVERFGADRCMFESNFPVDRVSYSYTVMWNAFKRVTADFSPEQRKALFFDTAARVYRLPSVDSSL